MLTLVVAYVTAYVVLMDRHPSVVGLAGVPGDSYFLRSVERFAARDARVPVVDAGWLTTVFIPIDWRYWRFHGRDRVWSVEDLQARGVVGW